MTHSIYILKLEGGRYFIGKTENLEKTIQDHRNGCVCDWTSMYKPIKIETVLDLLNPMDEDWYVKEYMYWFGIENVRGGSYSSITLAKEQVESLQMQIWGSTRYPSNPCFRCGRVGHFTSTCYAKTDRNGKTIESDSEYNSD